MKLPREYLEERKIWNKIKPHRSPLYTGQVTENESAKKCAML